MEDLEEENLYTYVNKLKEHTERKVWINRVEGITVLHTARKMCGNYAV